VPTEPDASTPIIAIDTAFVTLPTEAVPLTPLISTKEMVSANIVPTKPDDALPVMAKDAVPRAMLPIDRVEALPVMS
jgi:hypothetical protein